MSDTGELTYSKIFYKETIDVIEWCRENKITPQYLSVQEKEDFDNFSINVTLIRNNISLNQRREIFMSLQKGIPVRNSDFLKNKTDCKLVAFLVENGYEEMMTNTFFEHCYRKASNYWVHWVCRFYLLFKHFNKLFKDSKINNLPVSEIFLIEDKKIKKLIENNNPELNPITEAEIANIYAFDDSFRVFIEFLQKINNDYWNRLNPTQIYAVFYNLCDESNNEDFILSHIPYLSREGNSKSKRTLWESKDERAQRREYFNKCLSQINGIIDYALPFDDRNISKSLKNKVWAKCVNNLCVICEDNITENEFEVGHIVARSLGGQTELNNLIPVCFECNRGMGTKNAYEYKKDMYPEFRSFIEEV